MDSYKPSQFDLLLEKLDKLLQQGFTIVTGEVPFDFDRRARQWKGVLVPVESRDDRFRRLAARQTASRLS